MKHELFFDNFFTSYNLLADLAAKNVKAIGTVRENRTLGASSKMKSLKEMKKSDKETFDFCSDGVAYFCKRKDNSIVNIGSNFFSHLPIKTVKHQVKSKPDARITQPQLIKQYNNGMGGIDVIDQLLGSYRPMICGKKWYWPLIIHAINVSVVAAWQLHCAVAETPKNHLEFQSEIANCLRKSLMDERQKTTGCAISKLPSDLRYDSIDHFKHSTTQVDARYTTRILVQCVKSATSVFTQIKVQCVLRCIIHVYKLDSIQKSFYFFKCMRFFERLLRAFGSFC